MLISSDNRTARRSSPQYPGDRVGYCTLISLREMRAEYSILVGYPHDAEDSYDDHHVVNAFPCTADFSKQKDRAN